MHFAEWIGLKVYWREQRTIFSWQRLNTPLIFTGFKLHIMTTNLSWSSSKGTYSANPLTTVLGSEKEDQVGTLLIGTLLIGTLLIGTLLIGTLLIGTLLIGTLRSFDAMATRTSKNEKKTKETRKKRNRLRRQNNNFARAPHFFHTFLGCFLHDYDVKLTNFTFYGGHK